MFIVSLNLLEGLFGSSDEIRETAMPRSGGFIWKNDRRCLRPSAFYESPRSQLVTMEKQSKLEESSEQEPRCCAYSGSCI
jgi:hypothetical protein